MWTATPGYLILSGRIPAQLIGALRAALSYPVPGAWRTWKYRQRLWDGTKSLLFQDGDRYVVPGGLRPLVARAMRGAGLSTPLPAPGALLCGPMVATLPNGRELYPDQLEALKIACSRQQGCLDLAPSFGKTELMAALAATFGRRARVLVLVNATGLLHQNAERLEELLREPVATLGAGVDQSRRLGARILVATIQTARSRPAAIERWLAAEILLVDEAHTIGESWFPILGASQATVRLGLSGTLSDVTIPMIPQAFLGPIIHTVTERQLLAAKRTSPVQVLMPTIEHPLGLPEDYDELYDMAIVRNKTRNALLAEAIATCRSVDLPTVAIVYAIAHGEFLTQRVSALGHAVEWIHGKTPGFIQASVKRDFVAGTVGAIIASNVFKQGINLPNMRVVVNAAGWKSRGLTRQRVGRVARLKDEPDALAYMIDPYDTGPSRWRCSIHQRISDDRCCDAATPLRILLERHSRKRAATYRQLGYHVAIGPWASLAKTLARQV